VNSSASDNFGHQPLNNQKVQDCGLRVDKIFTKAQRQGNVRFRSLILCECRAENCSSHQTVFLQFASFWITITTHCLLQLACVPAVEKPPKRLGVLAAPGAGVDPKILEELAAPFAGAFAPKAGVIAPPNKLGVVAGKQGLLMIPQ